MAQKALSLRLLAFASLGLLATTSVMSTAWAGSSAGSPATVPWTPAVTEPLHSALNLAAIPGVPALPAGMRVAQAEPNAAAPYGVDRDIEYTERLASRGYREAAVWIVNRLKAMPGLKPEQQASVAFAEASILVADFENEKDFAKAAESHAKAKAGLEGYLKLNSKGATADRARILSGELDKKLGEKIGQEILRESSPEKVTELRKQGEKAFQDAIQYFQGRVDKLREEATAQNIDLSQAREVLLAEFSMADTYLSFARLYPEKDPMREQRLKLAADRFAEFTNECDQELMIWYTANTKAGNAYRDLNDATKAVDFYDQSLSLMEGSDENGDKYVRDDLTENEKALVLDALVEASRLKIGLKRHEEVIDEYATRAKKAIPDAEKFERGPDYFVELAHAHNLANKNDEAARFAQKAMNAASFDSAAFRGAQEMLDRLGVSVGGGSGPKLTEARVIGPVAGPLREGKIAEAMRAFDRMRLMIRGDAEEAKFAPKLISWGGYAYQAAGRPLEAVLLWESVATQYPGDKVAPAAVLEAVRAMCAYWKSVKSEWPDAVVRGLMERIPENAGEAAEAQGLYIDALQKLNKKDAFEVATLQEEALKTTQKTDAKFGKKAFDAGKMFVTARSGVAGLKDADKRRKLVEGARAGAERCFTQFLEWAAAQSTLDPEEIAKNDTRTADALIAMANMWLWEPGAQPEKAMAILQQLEERTSKSAAAKAKRWDLEEIRVRAFLKQGNLNQAVALVEGMATKAAENRKTVDSLSRVATECFQVAQKKETPPDRVAELTETAIRLLRAWITNGERQAGVIDAADYESAATKLFRLGLMKNGIDLSKGYTSFWDYRDAKLPFKEPLELAAEYYSKAIAANEQAATENFDVTFTRFRRGQALGLLAKWTELAAETNAIVNDGEMLEKVDTGYKITEATGKGSRNFRIQVLNERSIALARLAEKGDRAAGTEAQKIASAVESFTNPGNKEPTVEFWIARYVKVLAMQRNDERAACKAEIERYLLTDKELDKGKWGFDKLIRDIYDKVK
ncbi:MAG: hypothetical protein JNJ88_21425 [Planctomycetes bacterium]|nr:hypothetical protein [Planctomycetota bacterium]